MHNRFRTRVRINLRWGCFEASSRRECCCGGFTLSAKGTVFFLLVFTACSGSDIRHEPATRFGYLTASVDGEPFSGSFGRDSLVAIYDGTVGHLQIEGNDILNGWNSVVRLVISCSDTPRVGTYRVSTPFLTPVSAGVYNRLRRQWLPRPWRTKYRFYSSDSTHPGTLILDTFDLSNRMISGRFDVRVVGRRDMPTESLSVNGAFTGRILITETHRDRQVRWSPLANRDCKSALVHE